MMPIDEHPMLWISVENAEKLLRYASTRWRMYATTQEAWVLYLSTVVDAAVCVDEDVGPSFIQNGPQWIKHPSTATSGTLSENLALQWADNALVLLKKYKSKPRPKP